MRDLIESLSLQSGAVLIAVVSAILAIGWSSLPSIRVKWVLVVLTPLVLSYVLYNVPVWLGADSSEYSLWMPLVVAIWFVAGFTASAAVARVIGDRKAQGKNSRSATS